MVDSKSTSIPQWQRQGIAEGSEEPPNRTTGASIEDPKPSEDASSSRATLIDQASKFLQDESIRDASADRKIFFLETKGLTNEEIHSLLGVSKNIEASTTPPPPTLPGAKPASSPSTASSESTTSSSSSSPEPSSIPPIITYPEFLRPLPPPPLLTTPVLLKSLYATLATSAAMYTASTYILTPMLDSLTEARQSLFETALSNLHMLNEKLSGVVSVLPPPHSHGLNLTRDGEASEDIDSIFSDPTELFHRDTGTQTSPPPSPALSSSSSHPALDGAEPATPTANHQHSLHAIHTHLASTLDSSSSVTESDESLKQSMKDLLNYLDDVRYGRLRSAPDSLVHGAGSGVAGIAMVEDEIAKVKTEIKGFKGALLSAKNFPAGGRGRGRIGS